MRQYETGFIISPKLSDEEQEKLILQMADVVSKKKGKMLKEDRWRKRRLAYPIQKFEEGFYVFFLYEGEPDVSTELERRFKQTDAILRYLTVKKDPRPNVRRKRTDVSEEEKVEMKPEGEVEKGEEKKVSPSEEKKEEARVEEIEKEEV